MAVSSVPKKKHKSSLSKPCLITLRIELVRTTPLVWRRITLDGRSSFANLHHVIQAAMGWHDAHLHQFRINNRYIGVPDPESDAPEWHTEDERKVFLNRVLTDDAVFTYLYDFGDGWEHRLHVEEYDDSDDLRFGDGDAWVDAGERLTAPAYGCIVVFNRTGGGHVGFVVGRDREGNLMVLGGNQGNKVSIAKFAKDRVVAYVWPSNGSGNKPAQDRYRLPVLAANGAFSTNEA